MCCYVTVYTRSRLWANDANMDVVQDLWLYGWNAWLGCGTAHKTSQNYGRYLYCPGRSSAEIFVEVAEKIK